jgi:hypothetical protein
MTARSAIGAEFKILASAKLTIASPATTSFDFGTPDDVYLPGLSNFQSTDRIVACLFASTGGTTSTLTWVIQDADGPSTAIGTPATAVADTSLAGGTGDDFRFVGITLQSGRPWLRLRVTHATATDSFVCHAILVGLPAAI